MSTNVPAIQFTPNGIVLPQESAVLEGVQADINDAFGGGVNPGLSTPQGQIAQSMTAIIGDKNTQIAEMVNQVDPDTASGRWQDAIGRIYFMDRIAATGTVVTGTCTGLVGTVIPAGSVAQDNNGYLYYSLEDLTVGPTGSVQVDFQCTTTGPIACPVGTLSKIYQAIIGWDAVTNTSAGTPGVNVESRADFEFRRRNSVAANAVNSAQAIYASVLSVPDVLDAYVIDNDQSTEIHYGATHYPIAANSVFVCVAGGAPADVAKAIWRKKSLGCSYNGNTRHTVIDMVGYQPPYPTYEVTWLTPTPLPVHFAVNIATNSALPADITTLIKTAVIQAFNGEDDGERARIASVLYAGRYYAGVSQTDPNVNILEITLGVATNPTGTSLAIGIDQRPTLDATNITVNLV